MSVARLRGLLVDAMVAAALLALATVLVGFLEGPVGIDNAATAYLLAVVAAAAVLGVAAAVGTAVCAFLIYDLLFVSPVLTLSVHDSREWLALLLFLVVGLVVAWLAGQLRQRARDASTRESESNALYQVSRILATRPDIESVVSQLEAILARESGSARAAIVLASDAPTRTAADIPAPSWASRDRGVLRRTTHAGDSTWIRLHESAMTRRGEGDVVAWKAPVEAGGRVLGALWLLRARPAGPPGAAATRLLGVAADQIGQAVEQERSAAEAREMEIARQSDAFTSALLDSISHDLRTPLASIRAAAGTLLDPDIELGIDERRASAAAIDHEAEHLARLVSNLLDMSRIEGGALAPDLEAYEVADLVDRSLQRTAPRLTGRSVTCADLTDLPPVRVDAVLFDQVMVNLVENAVRYTPREAPLRVAGARSDRVVRVTVEDGGGGVPQASLAHLFDKFYRVRSPGEGSRPGSGIGLAVVRGLVRAMGGDVRARRSQLGGLAIDILLPEAMAPDDDRDGDPVATTVPLRGTV
jgi:two-component system sensor histidine kinase KdpD